MPTQKRLQIVSFLLILLLMAGLVFTVVQPFLNILVLGFILAVLFYPMSEWFSVKCKSHAWGALITLLIMLVIILVPVALLGQVIFTEVSNLYDNFRHGQFVLDRSQLVSGLPVQVQDFVTTASKDLSSVVSRVTANAFQTFSSVVSNLASFFLSFFLTMLATYYFMKDGRHFKEVLIDLSPIDNKQERILFVKITNAVNGVVKGQFLTAIIQGVVATVGYLIFGVPNAFLWGFFTMLAALVPTVGTSLALIPAVIYLLLTGQNAQALGLLIWGALAVGLVDNIIGPKVLGHSTRVHPLLMLIAVLGGVSVFGFLGFLLGPILMAVFVAMIDMYRKEFQEYIGN